MSENKPKEYIERGALIDRFDYYRECFVTEHDYDLAVTTVNGAAIEDDVVEVVRCSQCEHWRRGDCYRLELSRPDDYCSYGERKDGANNV